MSGFEEVSERELEIVKDILRTLLKTIKTFNVYPKDNPIYQKFAAELNTKFNTFFELHNDLPLDVEQDSLLYEDNEVFHSEERTADNIALFLWADGIRQITFEKGLTLVEITDFIDILRITPGADKLQDDLVTILWEKDLEHIGYAVVPDMLDGDAIPEEHFLPTGSEAEAGPYGASYSELTLKPVSMGFNVEPLTGDEEVALRTELFADETDALLISAVGLLFELMPAEKNTPDFSKMLNSIGEVVDFLLKKGKLHDVIKFLRVLHEIGRVSEADHRSAIARVIINKAGSGENLRGLFSGGFDSKDISRYVLYLGRAVLPRLIELLGELQDRKQRRLLCDILIEVGSKDMETFSKTLEDKRWFLVRNVVMILGMIKEPTAVKYIARVLKHPEPRVRREIVRTLDTIHSEEAKGLLLGLIKDVDPAVRISSLRSLRRFGKAPDIFMKIKDSASREHLKKMKFSEKKELLETLAVVGGESAFPLMSELFKKKGLIEKAENIEIRACSAYALGLLKNPEAIALLEKEADSRKPLIKEACRSALKEAKGGSGKGL